MDVVKSYEPKFQKIINSLKEELGGLRAGRATPALVENIEVELFGAKNRIKGLAAIAVPDPRTIVIQPWDRSYLEPIEKALRNSQSGFSPVVEQNTIRIELAALTEEKRQELKKLVNQKVEGARIKIRQIRDELWSKIQDMARKKEISEDEKFRLKDRMEDYVKKLSEEIKEMERRKEEELMRV